MSAQDFRRAVQIRREDFDLLDSLAEFLQVSLNGPGAGGLAGGQNIQIDLFSELQFELNGILIRRHVGKPWRSIGCADGCERLGSYRNPGDEPRRVQELTKFGISPPKVDRGPRQGGRSRMKLFRGELSFRGIGIGQAAYPESHVVGRLHFSPVQGVTGAGVIEFTLESATYFVSPGPTVTGTSHRGRASPTMAETSSVLIQ
jgi:hypothetical protein